MAVPKVVPPPPEAVPVAGDALDESASMKAKRVALQRKGAAAMIAAEEYARRFESGDVAVSVLAWNWNYVELMMIGWVLHLNCLGLVDSCGAGTLVWDFGALRFLC